MVISAMFIFQDTNVLNTNASLPFGPPVNIDTDYYQIFSFVRKSCDVSCAMFVREKKPVFAFKCLATSTGTILRPLV